MLLFGAAMAALVFGALPGSAHAGPAKPAKRSFSNGAQHPATAHAQDAKRQATEQELTDAILGAAMNDMWIQADRHFHEGEYNHVVNLSHVIVQGDPHNLEAFSNSAYLLWSTGRNEDAEAILKEGIAANPTSFYMYDEMGRYWFLERRDPKSAIPYFETATKYDCPGSTWHSLANCYEKASQWDKAVAAWSKATLFENNAIANVRLKQARERLAKQKAGH
jgi:tetratricopeptide (TPR) repeat protein